ncbi:MAG: ABC transporter permease [Planctomycetales bacterium]|nr:ABC transporter permease [Planctomycetales bacterium]
MNVFQIAWKSIRQRWLASSLTMASMALGVMLVVAVLSIHGVVSQQFRNNATLGYNLLVGADKGGRLQLTLNSIFYLSQPVENIDYRFYLQFVDEQERREAWSHSLAASKLRGSVEPATLTPEQLEQLGVPAKGDYTDYVAYAVPLCLGDYYGRFRVVATTTAFFEHLVVNNETGSGFAFQDGRPLENWNEEHGFFEAVIGSTVAREKNIKVGDHIFPAHGDPEGEAHEQGFYVAGVLAPSGTPNDRAVFVNMEGFFQMDKHAKPLSGEEAELESELEKLSAGADAATDAATDAPSDDNDGHKHGVDAHFAIRKPLDLEKREVTAVLVKTVNPFVGSNLKTMINEGKEGQCAEPVRQIYSLLEIFVRPIQWVLLILTGMICLVSGISILVSIYNSMSERRHELSVIRALGASQWTVTWIVLLEAMMLAMGGGLIGWGLGHGLNVAASGMVEERTGVRMDFLDFAPPIDLGEMLAVDTESEDGFSGFVGRMMGFLPAISPELLIIPALLALAVLVGLLPAYEAYRTDVATWLGK